jgi:transmembrane sensor
MHRTEHAAAIFHMTDPTELEAKAAAWLVRREAPDFSPEEQALLDSWLLASPRHRSAFLRLEAAWRRADRLKRLRPLDGRVDADLLSGPSILNIPQYPARTTTGSEDAPARPPPLQAAPPVRSRYGYWATAAAIAFVALGAALWTAIERPGWQTYATDFRAIERIVLTDGSLVHLNKNSRMRVRVGERRREIVLERGEAQFTVARDPARPFDVQADTTTVRAVGTVFSVRLGTGRDVEVIVKEGRVQIDPPQLQAVQANTDVAPPRISLLSAGETVRIKPRGQVEDIQVVKVAEADVSRKLSWTEGRRLIFDRQTLAEVVAEFNRYNRRQMVIADPVIAGRRVGGGFEATDIDSFIAALEHSFGIRAYPNPQEQPDAETIRLVGTQQDATGDESDPP